MHKITADIVYDGKGQALTDCVLALDKHGKILDIMDKAQAGNDIQHYTGIITPGFINAHCHIELSHLKNQIPSGTGLMEFIKKVVTIRDFPREVIDQSIEEGIRELESSGTVAVGDICNTTDTARAKLKSRMRFYNFIEAFDLFQANLDEQWVGFRKVFDDFQMKAEDRKAMVPHAPYSVSRHLFDRLHPLYFGGTVSMHNQETPDENTFARTGEGALTGFYRDMGLSLESYTAPGTTSLEYALQHLHGMERLLLVHNTMSDHEDVQTATSGDAEVFWCTCANANLYIENRLPDYQTLVDAGAQMCIGTDSLSSNWKLSVWDEIKTISKYRSALPLESLILWACLNGARALGFDEELGSLEVGKKPGINHIEIDPTSPVDQWTDDVHVLF